MPEIGEIRRATEIGRRGHNRLIWSACEGCGKERWVQFRKSQPINMLCHACSQKLNWRNPEYRAKYTGENNSKWKGGVTVDADGYIGIKLQPSDFFYSMARKSGYILEHRLVMARHLKCHLLPCQGKHNTYIEKALKQQAVEIAQLRQRVIQLEAELTLLGVSANYEQIGQKV